MESQSLIFDEKFIKDKLHSCDSPSRITLKDNFFTSSAVLFLIIPYEDKPYELVLIHRAEIGKRHRGEMSFPGGKFESDVDTSLKDTALRETEEEVGIPRENVKIIGCLDDFPTMTKYIITPYVAIVSKDQKLVKDDIEVQKIVKVPIDFFIKKKNFKEQAVDISGNKFPIFYFNFFDRKNDEKHVIWGATAYMISVFIERIYGMSMSNLGLERFKLERIKDLKEYIKYRNQITKKF
jgi:8-oxo-dGTP pyrophosphatase MutT (NUDIX family)